MSRRTFEQLLAEARGDKDLLLATARQNLRLHYLFNEGVYWALGQIIMSYEECQLVICHLVPNRRPDPLA